MDALAPYVEKAASKVAPEEFRARVARHREAFDGLLDDEALGLLVLDELGLNDGAFVDLASLENRPEASVEARVAGPPTTRSFARRDGGTGEVTNLPLEDGRGRAMLVLWGRDGDKAAGLKPGDAVRVLNARVKTSRFGVELVASPWTLLERPDALSPAKAKLLADTAEDAEGAETTRTVPVAAAGASPSPDVEGALLRVLPTRTYIAEGGGVGFACVAHLLVDGRELPVELHGDLVKAVRAIPPGTRVRVTGVLRGGAVARTREGSTVSPC